MDLSSRYPCAIPLIRVSQRLFGFLRLQRDINCQGCMVRRSTGRQNILRTVRTCTQEQEWASGPATAARSKEGQIVIEKWRVVYRP